MVEGAERGGELLWVEGQGALLHPAYSGRHARADARQRAARLRPLPPGRVDARSRAIPSTPIPPLTELVELHERASLPARPAKVARIALNTRDLGEAEARAAVAEAEAETGLPADDPVRFGAARLLEAVLLRTGTVSAER